MGNPIRKKKKHPYLEFRQVKSKSPINEPLRREPSIAARKAYNAIPVIECEFTPDFFDVEASPFDKHGRTLIFSKYECHPITKYFFEGITAFYTNNWKKEYKRAELIVVFTVLKAIEEAIYGRHPKTPFGQFEIVKLPVKKPFYLANYDSYIMHKYGLQKGGLQNLSSECRPDYEGGGIFLETYVSRSLQYTKQAFFPDLNTGKLLCETYLDEVYLPKIFLDDSKSRTHSVYGLSGQSLLKPSLWVLGWLKKEILDRGLENNFEYIDPRSLTSFCFSDDPSQLNIPKDLQDYSSLL